MRDTDRQNGRETSERDRLKCNLSCEETDYLRDIFGGKIICNTTDLN